MSGRTRVLVLVLAALVLLGGAGAYLLVASADYRQRAEAPSEADIAEATASATLADGQIVFRNTAAGVGYGLVASVPVDNPSGPRVVTAIACDRVAATATVASCLHTDRGIVTAFAATQYDASWQAMRSWPLAGIPSRTRLSADGGLLATTAFVTGHAYASIGFSTQTTIHTASGTDYGDLEDFSISVGGQALLAADRNVWGVTFADDDNTFYATVASSGVSWLVRGDLAARTLVAIAEGVECPSLSPDGSRIAYKKPMPGATGAFWSIAVLSLVDGTVTELPEPRSVDDQVEWLDNDTLLYGMPAEAAGDSNVWAIAADGDSAAALFIEHAWSPSVTGK